MRVTENQWAFSPRRLWPGILGLLVVLTPAYAFADTTKTFTTQLETALAGHHWALAAGVSYVLGLLTSLTPCVYPLIPITISLFGASDDKDKSRARSLGLALCYVGGIAAMYTGLGLFFGFTGKTFGTFLSSPYIMVPVILFFVLMAASLFGAFTLALPDELQALLTRVGGRGALGAFLMGLVAGLIAAPCTGPPLAALLTFVGTQHSAGLGGLMLFCYAVGIGTLFFALAGFSLRLPKSGAWMESVKSVLGIVMIVAAIYYLGNLIKAVKHYGRPDWIFLGAHLGLLAMGVVFGGVHLRFRRERFHGLRKGLGLLLIAARAFGVLSWMLTPKEAPVVVTEQPIVLHWYEDAQALLEAKKQQKPVLIEFSASWCFPCKEMKIKTFTDVRVKKALTQFVLWEVDCSEGDDTCEQLKKTYHAQGMPTVALLDRHGNWMHSTDGNFVSAEQLLPLLETVQRVP